MVKGGQARKISMLAVVIAVISLLVLTLSSCRGNEEDTSGAAGEDVKLPPAITEESLEETTGSGELALQEEEGAAEEREENATAPSPTGVSADLDGVRFTVVAATRPDSNEDVAASGQRVVEGDYLEVELTAENIGDELVDLSDYSFRLWSPGIDAVQYEDYYGSNGTYGEYVSDDIISAVLLDYVDLQPVGYKLKGGETAEGIFLFFDLNPLRTARNEGVTKEGSNLIFHDTDSGEEVEVNLAAFPD